MACPRCSTPTKAASSAAGSSPRSFRTAAQLTCHFDGSTNDDFQEPADDGDGDPQKGPDWYYQGYVLCTDANGDSAPDPAPTIPALNWEPPEWD